jgi:hypothetical protein
MGLIRFEGIIPAKLIILVVTALFAVSCACWNAMQPSRSIKIPPYRIEYYHSADGAPPSAEEKKSKGWYEQSVNDKLSMHYQVARVEESGIYFYQLLYRAVNAGDKPIAIYDQNIVLIDSATQQPIEQVQCWNWQKVSAPCNRVEAIPKGEVVKEVRFGYSTEERHAPGLIMQLRGLGAKDDVITIDFRTLGGLLQ